MYQSGNYTLRGLANLSGIAHSAISNWIKNIEELKKQEAECKKIKSDLYTHFPELKKTNASMIWPNKKQ